MFPSSSSSAPSTMHMHSSATMPATGAGGNVMATRHVLQTRTYNTAGVNGTTISLEPPAPGGNFFPSLAAPSFPAPAHARMATTHTNLKSALVATASTTNSQQQQQQLLHTPGFMPDQHHVGPCETSNLLEWRPYTSDETLGGVPRMMTMMRPHHQHQVPTQQHQQAPPPQSQQCQPVYPSMVGPPPQPRPTLLHHNPYEQLNPVNNNNNNNFYPGFQPQLPPPASVPLHLSHTYHPPPAHQQQHQQHQHHHSVPPYYDDTPLRHPSEFTAGLQFQPPPPTAAAAAQAATQRLVQMTVTAPTPQPTTLPYVNGHTFGGMESPQRNLASAEGMRDSTGVVTPFWAQFMTTTPGPIAQQQQQQHQHRTMHGAIPHSTMATHGAIPHSTMATLSLLRKRSSSEMSSESEDGQHQSRARSSSAPTSSLAVGRSKKERERERRSRINAAYERLAKLQGFDSQVRFRCQALYNAILLIHSFRVSGTNGWQIRRQPTPSIDEEEQQAASGSASESSATSLAGVPATEPRSNGVDQTCVQVEGPPPTALCGAEGGQTLKEPDTRDLTAAAVVGGIVAPVRDGVLEQEHAPKPSGAGVVPDTDMERVAVAAAGNNNTRPGENKVLEISRRTFEIHASSGAGGLNNVSAGGAEEA